MRYRTPSNPLGLKFNFSSLEKQSTELHYNAHTAKGIILHRLRCDSC